ncbi:NAD(P)/FAD-dependent oxidoreductase [Roseibium sp.]|uniref:NAD(P)/FAD-dependent oxidoreductase n=1 Tax=Roseibium sp. TaxID=1936156 RepID=UPI003A975120
MGHVGENEAITVDSYWEASVGEIKEDRQLVGSARFDVAVIGAGFTGLSAALKLAEAGLSVCVLEANRVGWGASGRNGGFCCFGGTKQPEAELIRKFGLDEAKRFLAYQIEAIETVEKRLSHWGLDVDRHSNGEVYLAHRPKDAAGFSEEAKFLNDTFGLGVRILTQGDMREQGLGGPEFHGAMHVPYGFALNPMKYVLGLAEAVRRGGGRIYAHTPVLSMSRSGEDWQLTTRHGVVSCRKVILAGNGYSREGAPDWLNGRLMPAMSSVLVTRPLSDDELEEQGWTSDLMAADTRILLHYFRLMPDRRFLFGTRGGIFETLESLKAVHKRGRADFERMFPAWAHVESEFRWHGHVCLARDLSAYVGPVPDMDGVYASLAYHGSGIAMASLSGEKVAELALGKIGPGDLPAVISKPLSKFPLPGLRKFYLQGAYWWYGLKDR